MLKPPDVPITAWKKYVMSDACQLEWAIEEKHAAQAAAEREKAAADALRLRVSELEAEILERIRSGE